MLLVSAARLRSKNFPVFSDLNTGFFGLTFDSEYDIFCYYLSSWILLKAVLTHLENSPVTYFYCIYTKSVSVGTACTTVGNWKSLLKELFVYCTLIVYKVGLQTFCLDEIGSALPHLHFEYLLRITFRANICGKLLSLKFVRIDQ